MSIVACEAAPQSAAASERPGFWSRLLNRIYEARMREAIAIIERHQHLLDAFDPARRKAGGNAPDRLPFAR